MIPPIDLKLFELYSETAFHWDEAVAEVFIKQTNRGLVYRIKLVYPFLDEEEEMFTAEHGMAECWLECASHRKNKVKLHYGYVDDELIDRWYEDDYTVELQLSGLAVFGLVQSLEQGRFLLWLQEPPNPVRPGNETTIGLLISRQVAIDDLDGETIYSGYWLRKQNGVYFVSSESGRASFSCDEWGFAEDIPFENYLCQIGVIYENDQCVIAVHELEGRKVAFEEQNLILQSWAQFDVPVLAYQPTEILNVTEAEPPRGLVVLCKDTVGHWEATV